MSDPATWRYGSVNFPLTGSTTNSALLDADPAIYWTLQYFASVIHTYAGTRFLAAAAVAPPIVSLTSANLTSIAQYVVPYDPTRFLTENQFKFPLLALYRVKERYEDKTIAWLHRMAQWKMEYILPPLNAGQCERMLPFLSSIGMILHNRIEELQDQSFQSDLLVWQSAGIESIFMGEATYGWYAGGGDLSFPSYTLTLDVKERLNYLPGSLQSFGGVDATIDAASPAGAPVTSFVQATYTAQDPTSFLGLLANYRPDAGVTLASDGQHVASIADSYTSGTTLSQATGTAQPILVNGQVTDFVGVKKPILRCDVGQFLVGTVAGMANDGGKTIVVLVRATLPGARQVLVAQTKASDTGATSITLEANPSGTAGRVGFSGQSSNYDDVDAQPDTQWHVHAITITGTTNGSTIASTTTYSLDGAVRNVSKNNGTGTWTGMSTANQIAIGALPGLASTTSSLADFGPCLVFNASITAAQLQAAVQYCKQWAGLL